MTEKKIWITDHKDFGDLEQKILGDKAQIIHLNLTEITSHPEKHKNLVGILNWHSPLNRNLLRILSDCKFIVRCGTGFDNVDLVAAKENGILVSNIPDYGVSEVADSASALILSQIRQIKFFEKNIQNDFNLWTKPSSFGLNRSSNHSLGLIGFGRIGSAVAYRMKNFNIDIGFYDPYVPAGIEKVYSLKRYETLSELVQNSTIISLHAPLTSETRGIISRELVTTFNPGTILVNTARGALIDNELTIFEGLKSEQISFFATDVYFEEPLNNDSDLIREWKSQTKLGSRITITPHVAYYSKQSLKELREKSAKNMLRFLSGITPLNILN